MGNLKGLKIVEAGGKHKVTISLGQFNNLDSIWESGNCLDLVDAIFLIEL